MGCPKCGEDGYIYKTVNGKIVKVLCEDNYHKTHITSKQREEISLSEKVEQDLSKYIPSPLYREVDFSVEELKKNTSVPKAILNKDKSFDTYATSLNNILREVEQYGRLRNSYFINAPDDMGKKYFVFTLMKQLLLSGKTPSKYIHISEIDNGYSDGNGLVPAVAFKDVDVIFVDAKAVLGETVLYTLDLLQAVSETKGIPLVVTCQIPYYQITRSAANKIKSLGSKRLVSDEVPKDYLGKLKNITTGDSFSNNLYAYRLNEFQEFAEAPRRSRVGKVEDTPNTQKRSQNKETSLGTRGPKKRK